jgi:hypothetical protein
MPAKHRKSIEKMIYERHPDFANLPLVEQYKILEKGPENIELAIADATTRQRWKSHYRQLLDALDAVEGMLKWSITKIIGAIPDEHINHIAARVKRASDVLKKIDARLEHDKSPR